MTETPKPPYRVPSMAEIVALPWNGYKVASTFSGCGGSCLGYRMAGYKVVWANEFVPAAQDSYRANAPGTILDTRDIRAVQSSEILKATGLKEGELDLFDGSPPCQAFSTAGKRERGWGQLKTYEHGAQQRNEDLFFEYIRLLRGLRPKVFVAENVSGLVKGVAKGYFKEILAGLKSSGYRVSCRVLDAQWLGVPQTRQRTIFVGVREDLGVDPAHPSPLPYRYSVRDALPWLTDVRSGPTGFGAGSLTLDRPAPTVSASAQAPYSGHSVQQVTLTVGEGSGYGAKTQGLDQPAPAIMAQGIGGSAISQHHLDGPVEMIAGNKDYEPIFRPIDSGPTPAILASGAHGGSGELRQGSISRKFTIAELKRLCGFPDDFILTGTYAQQWERLGNSVPPVMMRHIAETVRDRILRAVGES